MEESAKAISAAEDDFSGDEATSASDVAEPPSSAEASHEAGPHDPWKKVRKLALKQLDRFMSLEPKVLRGDDADAIHDLRVASRRLQQVLDLLYPAPRQGEIRKLRRRIRRSRRSLGEVRNCDVQLAQVERVLARKRAPRRDTWEAVRHYLLQRRSQNFEKAARKLSKLNLAVFYVRLKDVLAPNGHPPPTHTGHHHGEAEPPEASLFPERVTASLERVWQTFEGQVEQSRRDPQVGVIHGVRIAAKRLRYLTEVIHAFDVRGSARVLAWLRGLQEHLGNWHDLEVLEQMMIEMVARPDYLREHLDVAMGVERLILRNRGGKAKFRERYFQMTGDADGYQQVKDWVEGVLARRELRIEN
jgi:CHAD domain-containing protein